MSEHEKRRGQVLTFSRGGVRFGVYSRFVLEIVPLPPLTPMPGQSGALRGIFAYKGNIVPAYSFAAICREPTDEDERTCLIMREDEGGVVGLCVAEARDLLEENEDGESLEAGGMSCGMAAIDSVYKNGGDKVLVVDISRTLEVILRKEDSQ